MASEQRGSLAEWTSMVRAGRISRRTFIERAVALGLSSSAALTVLAGCSSTAPSAINYWNLFGGGDGVRMIQMQNDFVRSHPDINLNAVTLAWGEQIGRASCREECR